MLNLKSGNPATKAAGDAAWQRMRMAGAILAGVLVTALALTGVGAILLVGGLVLGGALAAGAASQKANEGHSKSHRENGWW